MSDLTNTSKIVSEQITPISEDIIIPKYRFDEINERYKKVKQTVINLEEVVKKKDQEIEKLLEDIETTESECAKAMSALKVKEIFVAGGLKKEEYENVVKRISCPTEEETLALATEIVNLITRKQ